VELIDPVEKVVHEPRDLVVAWRTFLPIVSDEKSAVGDCRDRRPFRHEIGVGLVRKLGREIIRQHRGEIHAGQTILIEGNEMNAVLFREFGLRRLRST